MQSVYVAGIGMTKFGKDPRSLAEICHDAAQTALTSSEIQEVEAIYIGVMNPEEFTGDSNIASHIADALGLTGIPAVRIETARSEERRVGKEWSSRWWPGPARKQVPS